MQEMNEKTFIIICSYPFNIFNICKGQAVSYKAGEKVTYTIQYGFINSRIAEHLN